MITEDAELILREGGVTPQHGSITQCVDDTQFPYRLPVAVIANPVSFAPSEVDQLKNSEAPDEVVIKVSGGGPHYWNRM